MTPECFCYMNIESILDRRTNAVLLFEMVIASREELLSHGASVGCQPVILLGTGGMSASSPVAGTSWVKVEPYAPVKI